MSYPKIIKEAALEKMFHTDSELRLGYLPSPRHTDETYQCRAE